MVGSREKANQRSSSSSNIFQDNKSAKNNAREPLKSQLSLPLTNGAASDSKGKKKQRQNSSNFTNQNHPTRRKPGRPKRDVKFCIIPLDSFYFFRFL